MKKSILIFVFALGFGVVSLTSCNNNQNTKQTKTEKTVKTAEAEYQCPMHCEGDKTYDKPGNCPVCGMKLEKINKAGKNSAAGHEGHNHM